MLDRNFHRDPANIVIAGGGVAALEDADRPTRDGSERRRGDGRLGRDTFSYRPLQVGEPFGLRSSQRYEIAKICRDLGAHFVHDRLVSVDAAAHTLSTADHRQVAYDLLVLAVCAPTRASERRRHLRSREGPEDFDEVLSASGEGLAEHLAIVVPDGASWTLPAYRARAADRRALTAQPHHADHLRTLSLEAFGAIVSEAITEILAELGVVLRTGEHAAIATPTALRLGWEWLEASRIVTLPLLSGPRLDGVSCDEHGFVVVDHHGLVDGSGDVYAAGDGTTVPIKQGGLAAQQADAAATHIAARLGAEVDPVRGATVLRGLLATARARATCAPSSTIPMEPRRSATSRSGGRPARSPPAGWRRTSRGSTRIAGNGAVPARARRLSRQRGSTGKVAMSRLPGFAASSVERPAPGDAFASSRLRPSPLVG